jgi:hypothetical protein
LQPGGIFGERIKDHFRGGQELTDPQTHEGSMKSRLAALLKEQGELKRHLITIEEE